MKEDMEKFKIGCEYKLDEIRSVLGGPLLASIATKNSEILYVKFKREKSNPNLPKEVWIKNGPIQLKSAMTWAKSGIAKPMFFKDSTKNSQWKYLGMAVAKVLYVDKEAIGYTKSKEISLVLTIEF
ncbi:MAG: hypothetical protein K2P81_00600 [Bacteriovoracaceae bacterium]|nr:hypothetical protein [Bacteriovoracaceae bacterium]